MENIDEQIQSLYEQLKAICSHIKEKTETLTKLNEEIQVKHAEIESYNKVSFMKKMNKQLEASKRKIARLEKQNAKLKNKNKELERTCKKKKESDRRDTISINISEEIS